MIKHTAIASGLLLLAGAVSASDNPTIVESNGFKACVAAAERDAKYLRVDSTFYIKHGEDSHTYYLNGSGRTSAGTGNVRIACKTNASGRRVTDLAIDSGRYVGRIASEIASN
jgi:hypothetical protein